MVVSLKPYLGKTHTSWETLQRKKKVRPTQFQKFKCSKLLQEKMLDQNYQTLSNSRSQEYRINTNRVIASQKLLGVKIKTPAAPFVHLQNNLGQQYRHLLHPARAYWSTLLTHCPPLHVMSVDGLAPNSWCRPTSPLYLRSSAVVGPQESCQKD